MGRDRGLGGQGGQGADAHGKAKPGRRAGKWNEADNMAGRAVRGKKSGQQAAVNASEDAAASAPARDIHTRNDRDMSLTAYVEPHDTVFVLNPSGDLKKTEDSFRQRFSSTPGWQVSWVAGSLAAA